MYPSDSRRIKHKKGWIKEEIIVPRSHTDVVLSKKGMTAWKKLTDEEKRWISLDGTMGGGYSREHYSPVKGEYGAIKLQFAAGGGGTPVHVQYRKVTKLLHLASKRKRKPRKGTVPTVNIPTIDYILRGR